MNKDYDNLDEYTFEDFPEIDYDYPDDFGYDDPSDDRERYYF